MFGYVMANSGSLSDREKERYKSAYCGLCHALGRLHGVFSRLTLNYDLTFLAIFLAALYEEEVIVQTGRCPLHPLKQRRYCTAAAIDYAADMNIALSYYNLLDNWQDDKNHIAHAEMKLLEKHRRQVEAAYPRQCAAISDELMNLAKLEQQNELNPDLPAACFGRLMAEIFVRQEDEYAQNLRRFGFALGKFIYLLDAMLDLKQDIKQEKYNPLVTFPTENFREILCLLMADCTAAFAEFPHLRQDELLTNILYSGVWMKFEMQQNKEKKKTEKQKKV